MYVVRTPHACDTHSFRWGVLSGPLEPTDPHDDCLRLPGYLFLPSLLFFRRLKMREAAMHMTNTTSYTCSSSSRCCCRRRCRTRLLLLVILFSRLNTSSALQRLLLLLLLLLGFPLPCPATSNCNSCSSSSIVILSVL